MSKAQDKLRAIREFILSEYEDEQAKALEGEVVSSNAQETWNNIHDLMELILDLEQDAAFLQALKDAGVDNWEGRDYACELFQDQFYN